MKSLQTRQASNKLMYSRQCLLVAWRWIQSRLSLSRWAKRKLLRRHKGTIVLPDNQDSLQGHTLIGVCSCMAILPVPMGLLLCLINSMLYCVCSFTSITTHSKPFPHTSLMHITSVYIRGNNMHWSKLLPQSGIEWLLCAIGSVACYAILWIVLAYGTIFF